MTKSIIGLLVVAVALTSMVTGCAGEAMQGGSVEATPADSAADLPHAPEDVAVERPKTFEAHSLCNHPVYSLDGVWVDWFAEFELPAVPQSAVAIGAGETHLPFAGEDIDLGYVMVGSCGTVARVHCAVGELVAPYAYHGFQDVTFKAVLR